MSKSPLRLYLLTPDFTLLDGIAIETGGTGPDAVGNNQERRQAVCEGLYRRLRSMVMAHAVGAGNPDLEPVHSTPGQAALPAYRVFICWQAAIVDEWEATAPAFAAEHGRDTLPVMGRLNYSLLRALGKIPPPAKDTYRSLADERPDDERQVLNVTTETAVPAPLSMAAQEVGCKTIITYRPTNAVITGLLSLLEAFGTVSARPGYIQVQGNEIANAHQVMRVLANAWTRRLIS